MTDLARADTHQPWVDEAWTQAEQWAAADPVHAELMAVLAELGELIASGRTDPSFAAECRELVDRTVQLGEMSQKRWEQDWAIACTRRCHLG